MKRLLLLVALLASLSAEALADNKKKDDADTTSAAPTKTKYDKIIDKQVDSCKGMFVLRLSGGKVYAEIPESMLGREFLLGSTIKSISDNANGIVGAKSTQDNLLHVTFTLRDSTLLMREVESDYITSDSSIESALSKSNIGPIIRSFKSEAKVPGGSYIYDLTPLFLEHDKKMSPFLETAANARYDRNEKYKKELSYISGIKAFDDNISVTSTMSYTYTMKMKGESKPVAEDAPLTAVMTRSLLLLPVKAYHPRIGDYRIGYFHTERTQLGDIVSSTKPLYLANRWRLEPKDTAAFRRGELVEPLKPITFYIDSDFPEWWKPYIKSSVEEWSQMFEAAGFSNAVVAKEFPKDDPEFDPDNIKYSCVRYAPIGIQNAMGPSWVDPRSGEIITASVYVYHDIIKLLSRWLFVQTAQTDERVRHSYIPQEIMGEALCYVIRHEVGHCLGLMHNMSASTVIPVDSLRSPSYTQRYGTTTSIMDYARFNYVAQPGDRERGVALMPPTFGEYDRYAIRWGYTPVFDVDNLLQEGKISSSWITDSIKADHIYRYGKQQLYSTLFDPRCQNEDLGDNAVQASRYGVKNLKYIMENFMDWAGDDDEDYQIRVGYYNAIISQFKTYCQHVLLNVGGFYKNEVKAVDSLAPFANIPRERQMEHLEYMFELESDLAWLSSERIVNNLPVVGSPERALRQSIQSLILMTPFLASRSDGVVTKELSSSELFDIIFAKVWGPTRRGRRLTEGQRDFQRLYVTSLMSSAGYKYPGTSSSLALDATPVGGRSDDFSLGELTYSPVEGYEWTPRAIFNTGDITQGTIYVELQRVLRLLKAKCKSASSLDRAHYEMLIGSIEYGLGL